MNHSSSGPSDSHAPAAPADIISLAEQRANARIARDWSAADELRARIEEAGWKIVDDGADFSLTPVRAPDVVAGDRTVYGHADAVPSLLGAPATTAATVVVVARVIDDSLAATLAAVASEATPGTQRIVVLADVAAGDAETPVLEADEVVWIAGDLGPGVSLQAGARRATGAVVIALAPDHVASGDFVAPLLAALDDPAVGVAGTSGLRSADLHHFEHAESGAVTALAAGCLAFRRADLIDRGPLDDRLRLTDSVATWWSLVLRDQGEDATPRTALAIDLPLAAATETTTDSGAGAVHEAPRDRRAMRDRYRISDRFGGRDDLAG